EQQNEVVRQVLHATGLMRGPDFLAGQWWRLLSSCFVHIGLLHLGMNLYALHVIGRNVEWMFGHARFLALYLLAGIGGSCAALAVNPGGGAGASGALCGLIAAEAVWLLFYRGLLPPRLVSEQWRGLIITGVLITVISMLPGISGAGHLGGAVTGAVAAVL